MEKGALCKCFAHKANDRGKAMEVDNHLYAAYRG